MPLTSLSAEERTVVHECLRCVAAGVLVPHDDEFHSLFGVHPDEVQAVLSQWPRVDDSEERVYLSINNSMNTLLHLVREPELARHVAYSKREIDQVFQKWKQGLARPSVPDSPLQLKWLGVARLFAFALDWLVIALWGGALFGVVMLATGGEPRQPGSPWLAQGIGFVSMTLPVLLYFAICERSRWQGTVGKRWCGLCVSRAAGGRLSFGAALLRNAVKFTPWECGHTVAQQAIFSGEGGFPAWVWIPAAVAFLGPVVWIVALLRTGRTPYDRIASARVHRAADGARTFRPEPAGPEGRRRAGT
jgi:uncharacterized RDD family membrane protein YckC